MIRSTLYLSLSLVAAMLCASAAVAEPFELKVTSAGVRQMGDYQPFKTPKLKSAVAAFGKPDSVRKVARGEACKVRWRDLGLTMTFAYYGLPRKSACKPKRGLAQAGTISGANGTANWITTEGLTVGDTETTAKALYPKATSEGRSLILVTGDTPIGSGDLALLQAGIRNSKVKSLDFWIGTAGD